MAEKGKEQMGSNGSGKTRIVERVIRESDGVAHFPPLTRTNYADWAILMKVQLEAQGLWDVVEDDPGDHREDRRAMSVLLRAVPLELIRTLGRKRTAKEAWDTLKIMRVGVERVHEAKAQTRHTEFENLAFKDGEGVEAFGIQLAAIIIDLEVLGELVFEHKAVLKFLRSVPHAYKQMAMAIESLLDLKTLSIEELIGRLLVVEERGELDDVKPSSDCLLLTEEEWKARQRQYERRKVSFNDGNKKGKSQTKSRRTAWNMAKPSSSSDDNSERKKGNCHYCGISVIGLKSAARRSETGSGCNK